MKYLDFQQHVLYNIAHDRLLYHTTKKYITSLLLHKPSIIPGYITHAYIHIQTWTTHTSTQTQDNTPKQASKQQKTFNLQPLWSFRDLSQHL